jgi:MSHA biogenesis protein MshL
MIVFNQNKPHNLHLVRGRADQAWRFGVLLGAAVLAGCASDRPLRTPEVGAAIRAEVPVVAAPRPLAVPARVSESLAEPAPPAVPTAPEPKVDLLLNNANAREVFLAIVADTRYSMLMHPDVAGTLSVTLRGVTVPEALESIRDVYGYDFKIDGRRITVYAPTLQTRIFTINYPHSQRVGNSELRVSPGAGLQSGTGSATSSAAVPSSSAQQGEGSRVSTTSKTDFWAELAGAVQSMVGSGAGRSVVTSPQAGIMAVRAMPEELRQVDRFLKAAQIAVERQVMLEAKIVEVELRDGFQSGIDWSALRNRGGSTGAIGSIGGGTSALTSSNTLVRGVQPNLPGFSEGTALLADTLALPSAGAGLFGLALATEGFQAVLGFLETQGDIQILSSPRIATLNNQKAVLKVGSEDFFVTNFTPAVQSTVAATVGSATLPAQPTPVLTPFFSGIALDVTPQIDDGTNIMLHIHPSVTTVTEKSKSFGSYGSQPMASSSINESDTLVRIQDGHIVAIGGLMQIESNSRSSGLPGSSDSAFFGTFFGNRAKTGRKKEVVVLIKPTVIRSAQDWEAQTRRSRAALDDMEVTRARVIRLDGSVDDSRVRTQAK